MNMQYELTQKACSSSKYDAKYTHMKSNPEQKNTKKSLIPAIVSEGHPALREMSKEIPLSEIQTPEIQGLIADMKKSLASQSDGIGLAAPQIGVPLRIFIVSKKIFSIHSSTKSPTHSSISSSDSSKNPSTQSQSNKKVNKDTIASRKDTAVSIHEPASTDTTTRESTKKLDDLVFINPILVKESKAKKWMEGEGCLSVRWVYGKVKRSTNVTIRAYDEQGRVFERGAGGLLAHIFQHEIDHLNGILFIDKAKDLEEVDPKDQK
jgi:peptide deformylase